MSRHFSIKNIFPPTLLSVPRGLFTGRRHHFVSSVLIHDILFEKSFQIEKKRRNKKILCTRLLLQSSPASWSRVTTLSSTIGLHPPPPPPAYYTQIMMVAHWKPVIAGFNPVASVYFIFLQLIFRQRPPVTWGGIVSKTGETKTNSTGFIYLFFCCCCCCFDCYKAQKKRKRETLLK